MSFRDVECQITQFGDLSGIARNTVYNLEESSIINPKRVKTGKISRRYYTIEDVYLVKKHYSEKRLSFPCRVELFANNKGGVGKTTISTQYTINASLYVDKPVLFIDIDPQAHGTKCLGINSTSNLPNLRDVIKNNINIKDTILKQTSMLHVIPTHLSMSTLEMDMIGMMYREQLITKIIEPIKNEYSLIIMDTNPSLSSLNLSALVASDEVYLISDSENLSLDGISNFTGIIDSIKKQSGKNIKIKVIPNKLNLGRNDHKSVYSKLFNTYGENVLSPIRLDSTFSQAQNNSNFVYFTKSKSNAYEDLQKLTSDILKVYKEDR